MNVKFNQDIELFHWHYIYRKEEPSIEKSIQFPDYPTIDHCVSVKGRFPSIGLFLRAPEEAKVTKCI